MQFSLLTSFVDMKQEEGWTEISVEIGNGISNCTRLNYNKNVWEENCASIYKYNDTSIPYLLLAQPMK